MFKRFSSLKKLFSNDNKVEHEDLKLHSLSPINNIEEVDAKYKTYNDILYFALNEKSIHNIAITGQYGSGKSTVIDSYFKDKPHKDFFKISLATFSVSNNEKTETNIKLIEKGILQQMFYRKAADAFPFSRFKRIKAYHPFYIVLLEICLLCSICFLSIVLKPEWLKTIHDLIKETYYYITFIIATLGFFIIVFFVMKFFLKFRLTKFTFQKIEFGLDDVKDESLLNKYVDEILYFFEKTKYKIVIFEDLDRFENTEIFYHLRELNSLINNYEKINHRVTFIYALRDEVFEDKNDRTKFFDFIIPIVPVMDAHNSNAILLTEPVLSNSNIDRNFLEEISVFIDDRRLLTNCINEFKIYDKIIDSGNKKILFALIVYKNFYPRNFTTLDERLVKIKAGDIKIDEKDNYLEKYLVTNVINESNIKNIYRFLYWNNEKNNSDNEFLKLVENKKAPSFQKKLVDRKNVFAKLSDNKSWWDNNYAILNNDFLDYLIENKDADYADDLRKFIDTMFKYDQTHSDKFFVQYQKNHNLSYFYSNINKYIVESNADYDVFFKDNPKELLQFFLCVNEIDNEKFMKFIRHEITFIKETKESILHTFINAKKENAKFKDYILKHIENIQENENTFTKVTSEEIVNLLKSNELEVTNFLIKCFEQLYYLSINK